MPTPVIFHHFGELFLIEQASICLLYTSIAEQEVDLSSKSSLAIDEELHLTELTLETLKSFDRLSPFGMDNKKPVFLVRNFKVEGARSMGAGNTHLKLKISQEDATFEVVAFGLGSLEAEFAQAQDLELAVQLSVNQWNGQTTLQLMLVDARVDGVQPVSYTHLDVYKRQM